jgi:hypothetical protein
MNTIRTMTMAALLGAGSLGLQGCGAEDASAAAGSTGGFLQPTLSSGSGGTDDSVTVSWIAPTQRQDGSELSMTELAGYRIHYGPSSGNYTETVTIDDPYDMDLVLSGLRTGEPVYVVVEAVDTDGLASGPSEEVSVVVN